MTNTIKQRHKWNKYGLMKSVLINGYIKKYKSKSMSN